MAILQQLHNITQRVIFLGDESQYTPRAWKSRLTTYEKALTLWQDGYTWETILHSPGVYTVHLPPGEVRVDRKTGEITTEYTVDTLTSTCNCLGFERMEGLCKHLIAIQLKLADAHAFMAPFYAQMLATTVQSVGAPAVQSIDAPAVGTVSVSPAPIPHVPECPECQGTNLIPLADFPGTVACGRCAHWFELDKLPANFPTKTTTTLDVPTYRETLTESVIRASDFD